jgi:hypothetical protein
MYALDNSAKNCIKKIENINKAINIIRLDLSDN